MSIKVPNSWNNRLKSIAEGLAAAIPEVGKVVKLLINLFWPDTKESIWSAIKEQVEQLVDKKILDFELQERTAALNGLRDSLNMYTQASVDEKASLLSAILVSCNNLYQELTSSKNAIHLIPITLSHAYLHLTMLTERFEHGLEMYEDAKNKDQWQKELTAKVDDYKEFLLDIYPKWREWRNGEVKVTCNTTKSGTPVPPFFYSIANGNTKDAVTGEDVTYKDDWNAIENYFKPVQYRAKERMFHEADAKMMMEAYIRAFSLDNFLPGHHKDDPKADSKVGSVSYGPYSIALKGGLHPDSDRLNIDGSLQSDKCGIIKSICVYAWNTVDRIQFSYEDRGLGTKYGDDSSDDKTPLKNEIILEGRHVIGGNLGYAEGLLSKIQFHFSDGTSSPIYGNPIYGNKGGWGMALDHEFRADSDFRLVGAEARAGKGPSATRGVAEMRFIFQHVSLIPS